MEALKIKRNNKINDVLKLARGETHEFWILRILFLFQGVWPQENWRIYISKGHGDYSSQMTNMDCLPPR